MRSATVITALLLGLFARRAEAECRTPDSCVDPEPLWLAPSAGRFFSISDAGATDAQSVRAGAAFGFRLRPAVLTAPSPNRDGRDINVIRHATDVSLASQLGIGHGLELTVVASAGLYQRGAGIKGATSQSAEAVAARGFHDPRAGFGFALPRWSRSIETKLRFEAKLPLGTASAASTEAGPVASPRLVLQSAHRRVFAAAELGLRLRRPSELFGLRVGSQALVALGLGYELDAPHLSFTLEAYALPSLIDSGPLASTPGEWLLGTSLRLGERSPVSLGLAGGGGLPLSSDAAGTRLAYGVPTLRALAFLRYAWPGR